LEDKPQVRANFPRLLLLAVILTATVGAGIFDVAFPDVMPIRPYSHVFSFAPLTMAVGRSSSVVSDILIVSLVIVLIASLIRAVANTTTGITISHTGFTPSVNITGTPGLSSILQLFPLVFAFIGIAVAASYFRKEEAGI
jgi:hypothetical protein